ncbi:MAG: hypothetical protein AABY30_01340, partial [Candidatus Thermoplasmatota archaeon]
GNEGLVTFAVTTDGTPPAIGELAIPTEVPSEITVSVTEPHGPTLVALHWRVEGGTWETLPMESTDGITYRATIVAEGQVEAYVTAEDALGNAAQSDVATARLPRHSEPPRAPGFPVWLLAAVAVALAVTVLLLFWRRRRSRPAEGLPAEGHVGQEREQQDEHE